MDQHQSVLPARRADAWKPVSEEPGHPLSPLDGETLAGHRIRVLLGPSSRFGARYFALTLSDAEENVTAEPVLSGLHNSGPLPSYNWVEVAQTNERLALLNGNPVYVVAQEMERLFALLLALLPAGGHIMVEYDSPQRAETARGLALGVPAIVTPLGELLFRIGFGAHFKDWQIAEGGNEGPRKLQAYKSPTSDDTDRWRREAARDLESFLQRSPSSSDIVRAARDRATLLLPQLES